MHRAFKNNYGHLAVTVCKEPEGDDLTSCFHIPMPFSVLVYEPKIQLTPYARFLRSAGMPSCLMSLPLIVRRCKITTFL